MQLSSASVDFYLLCYRPVDLQIWTLLTRSQCVESLILSWPLRPVGLLFFSNLCAWTLFLWRYNTALNSFNSYSSSLARLHASRLLIDGLLTRYFILRYNLVWTSSNKHARNRDYGDKNETKHLRFKKVTKNKKEIKIKQE